MSTTPIEMLLDFLKAAPGFFIPGSLHIQKP
jgi:hypothetical protein